MRKPPSKHCMMTSDSVRTRIDIIGRNRIDEQSQVEESGLWVR